MDKVEKIMQKYSGVLTAFLQILLCLAAIRAALKPDKYTKKLRKQATKSKMKEKKLEAKLRLKEKKTLAKIKMKGDIKKAKQKNKNKNKKAKNNR